MYAFESSPHKVSFHLLVCGCFGVALLLFGISGIPEIAYPSLYQMTAVALLVGGVYLLSGYVLKLYRYEVAESGVCDAHGDPLYELVITEIMGRRCRVVTRVSLRDMDCAVLMTRQARKKLPKELKQYRYDNHPYASVNLYLFLPEEKAVTIIPADEGMMNILKRFTTVRKDGEEV